MSAILEILQKFCAGPTDPRAALHSPFSQGKYTYAANGHIIIRVLRIDAVPENKMAPNIEKGQMVQFFEDSGEPWVDMPDFLVEIIDAPVLDGECHRCDGRGELPDGDECAFCGGVGLVHFSTTIRTIKDKSVEILGHPFSSKYMSIISELPGAKVRVKAGESQLHLQFSFDGGDGAVMGKRG